MSPMPGIFRRSKPLPSLADQFRAVNEAEDALKTESMCEVAERCKTEELKNTDFLRNLTAPVVKT